jgi:hypothetical protein
MASADMKITVEGLKDFTDAMAALTRGVEELSTAVVYGTTVARLANRYRLEQSLDLIAEEYGRLPTGLQDALIKFCQDFPAIVDRGA